MVVREDHACAVMNRRIGNDLAKRKLGPAFIAVMARQMDAPRLIIDMSDPDMFQGRVGLGEAIGEKSPGRFEAVETQR